MVLVCLQADWLHAACDKQLLQLDKTEFNIIEGVKNPTHTDEVNLKTLRFSSLSVSVELFSLNPLPLRFYFQFSALNNLQKAGQMLIWSCGACFKENV